jgi:PPP family 3-phenylpropionic acid transporter
MSLPPLTPEQQVKPAHFELRMSLAFGTLFLATGVHVPYFPVWLEGKGFGPNDIAIILSLPMFLRVFTTPIITTLADRASDRATVLTALVGATAFLSLGYLLPPTYAVVLLVSLLLQVVWTPHPALADSVALSGVRRFGCSYTGMRIWGSISYLAANLFGGIILSWTGYDAVPTLMFVGLAAFFVATFFVPRVGPPRRASQPALDALNASSAFDRRFLYAVIGAGLIAASHAFINSFMSIYWKSIGYGDALIGFLWSWSVAAEVVIFWVFPRVFGRASATRILMIAAVFSVIRWVGFALITPLGLGVAGYFVVQTLHAFSTGLMLIGVQKLIGEDVPEERTGAAQGIAYLANGIFAAAVTLASGPLYETLGQYGTVPMIAIAALAAFCIQRAMAQPQRAAIGGETSEPE